MVQIFKIIPPQQDLCIKPSQRDFLAFSKKSILKFTLCLNRMLEVMGFWKVLNMRACQVFS